MALEIRDVLLGGELINTQRNSLYGWLRLSGRRRSVRLSLTGNADGPLQGRRLQFRAVEPRGESRKRGGNGQAPPCPEGLGLRSYQIGPVHCLHLHGRQVQSQSKGRARLHLRWSGQTGEVVVGGLRVAYQWDSSSQSKSVPLQTSDPLTGTASWIDDEHVAALYDALLRGPGTDNLVSDPFHEVLPADFQDLLEEMFSGRRDVTLQDIVTDELPLAPPSKLTESACRGHLERVLARLARHGVAYDLCEHCSACDAYRILVDKLLPRETTYADLPRTGYVQHIMSHEHCRQCARELDELMG